MKICFTLLWIVLFAFTMTTAQARGKKDVEKLLHEITRSIEKIDKSAYNLSAKEVSKIISRLEKYDANKIALPDTGQFVHIREQLFDVFMRFDELVNNIALRTRHPERVIPLANAYFHALDELEKAMRKAFKKFHYESQFIFMLPFTQSMNAFIFGRVNLLFLAASVVAKIETDDNRLTGWNLILKMSDQIEYEKLTPHRTLHRDYLLLTLERLLKFIDLAEAALKEETNDTIRKKADDFVNDFVAKREQLRYLYQKAKEWEELQNARNAGFWFEKGEAATDNNEKIFFYSRAIELNPRSAPAFNNRGNAYQELGRYEQAIADYDQAIALEPAKAHTFLNRGNAHKELGHLAEAIQDYSRAIELKIPGAQAYANRGNCYRILQDYQKAIPDYDIALQLNSGDALTYNNRGVCYRYLKNYEQAVRDHQKSIEIKPTANAWYNMGVAYWSVKSWNDVIRAWENCLKLDPNHEKAKTWLPKAKRQRRLR